MSRATTEHRGPPWAWIGSFLAHGVVLAAILALPRRPPPPSQPAIEGVAVELIDASTLAPPPVFEPVPPQPAAPPESPSTETPQPETPTTEQPPRSAPDSNRPAIPASPSPATSDAPTTDDAPVTDDAPPPSGSLLTMRGASRSAARGVPRPNVIAPKAPSKPLPLPSAPLGPALPPNAPPDDRPARSLAAAGFKRRKDGTYKYRDPHAAFTAKLHPNGRVEFKFKGTAVHRMGMSDAMRAGAGEELFARAKRALLKRTFELRLAMAEDWAKTQIDRTLSDLGPQLDKIWRRSDWPAAKRRKAIFSLWDDCEEAPPKRAKDDRTVDSVLDHARKNAGKKARKKIVAFVRRRLPQGSENAYSDDELRSLNAGRRSRRKFAPYPETKKEGTSEVPSPGHEPG